MPDLRSHFFLPEAPGAIELRAFTHGLMPRTVPAMMAHFVTDWQRFGVDAWNRVPNHWLPESGEAVGWWSLPTYLGDRFVAPLLGAPEGGCILQPNANWTAHALFSAPEPFRGRDEVVITGSEFPSLLHAARRWADAGAFRLRILPPAADGFVDRRAVLDAVGPRTALVCLSHVGFTTGEKLPDDFLREAARRTRAHGGLFALDGYHAVGSNPLRVTELEVDVYLGGLLKEASGSSGNAFVYLRPGVELTPRIAGWFADADPFAFSPEPRPHAEVRRRFLGGTPAVAPFYHAVEGARVLLEAGLEAVRAGSLALTARCIAHADALGLALVSPREEERRSALVVLEAAGADRLSAFLKTQGVLTDSRRGRYLRMAPFVWNSPEEVDRAFGLIGEALRSGRYRSYVPDRTGPVT